MVKRSSSQAFGPMANKFMPYKKRTMIIPARKIRNRAPKGAYVKGAIAPFGGRRELKYVDVSSAGYACDTTGSVTALNLIAVGDDNNTRDGRQVTLKSVQVKGLLKPVDDDSNDSLVRWLLVWDNAVNSGALPAISDILTTSNALSFPKIDNNQRFTILHDEHFAIGKRSTSATQSFAAGQQVCPVNFYKSLNLETKFSGTTAAIGSIQNGGLYLVTIGTQAVNAGGTFDAATRVRFTDS